MSGTSKHTPADLEGRFLRSTEKQGTSHQSAESTPMSTTQRRGHNSPARHACAGWPRQRGALPRTGDARAGVAACTCMRRRMVASPGLFPVLAILILTLTSPPQLSKVKPTPPDPGIGAPEFQSADVPLEEPDLGGDIGVLIAVQLRQDSAVISRELERQDRVLREIAPDSPWWLVKDLDNY